MEAHQDSDRERLADVPEEGDPSGSELAEVIPVDDALVSVDHDHRRTVQAHLVDEPLHELRGGAEVVYDGRDDEVAFAEA